MNTKLNSLLGLAGALALASTLGRGTAPSPTLALTELAVLSTQAPAAAPLGAAFTYQGQLRKGGSPVSDACNAAFSLYDAANGGAQIGGTVTSPTLQVYGGLFTIALDFGPGAFDGQARWLETSVGCGEAPAVLAPRTALNATPYALYAAKAGNVQGTLYSPLLRPQTLDLASADAGLKGFYGGFTDGRYGYFVPSSNDSGRSGIVARVDLHNFTTGGVTSLDLASVDAGLKSFAGGFTDGRYGYFVPNTNDSGRSGKVARVDLQNFVTATVTALDLTSVDAGLKGFIGGFTDGRYGYFVPFLNDGYSGKVARVDLQNFTTGGVTSLDLASVDPGLRGFQGGFTDGRYGYFVPFYNGSARSGKVARVDLQNFTSGGVTSLDLASVDAGLKGFNGGFTDGRYGYFVPNGNNSGPSGKVARADLQNFTAGGVSWLDMASTDAGLKGFFGGFTDGRYGYFVPFYINGAFSGKVARADLQNFTTSGVSWLDMASTDAGLTGFFGGFTDGRYGYFVPNSVNSGWSGKVARVQLFSNGAP